MFVPNFGLAAENARALLARLHPNIGYLSCLDGALHVLRCSLGQPCGTPVLHAPGIVHAISGSLLLLSGKDRISLHAGQAYVLTCPRPFSIEIEPGSEGPLEVAVIGKQVLTAQALAKGSGEKTGLHRQADGEHAHRLIELLVHRMGTFRFLESEVEGLSGLAFLATAPGIDGALLKIQRRFADELQVSQLARQSGMSESTFRLKFREATQLSPLEYLRLTRLHQARVRMIWGGASPAFARRDVCYESQSNFNTEFRKLFGHSPAMAETSALTGGALLGCQVSSREVALES